MTAPRTTSHNEPRPQVTLAQRAANVREASARHRERKKARRPLPKQVHSLSPEQIMSLYGKADAEPLPQGQTPALNSVQDIQNRLSCLYRERDTIDRELTRLHALTPTS
jgi:hypothetical protein